MTTVREQWAMICPACKDDESLEVTVKVWAKLSTDGTETDGDHEWSDDSACQCGCGWSGFVEQAREACEQQNDLAELAQHRRRKRALKRLKA